MNITYVATKPPIIVIAAAAHVEILRSLCGLSEPFLRRTNAIPRIDAIRPTEANTSGKYIIFERIS